MCSTPAVPAWRTCKYSSMNERCPTRAGAVIISCLFHQCSGRNKQDTARYASTDTVCDLMHKVGDCTRLYRSQEERMRLAFSIVWFWLAFNIVRKKIEPPMRRAKRQWRERREKKIKVEHWFMGGILEDHLKAQILLWNNRTRNYTRGFCCMYIFCLEQIYQHWSSNSGSHYAWPPDCAPLSVRIWC